MKRETIFGLALLGVFAYITQRRAVADSQPVTVASHFTTPNKPRSAATNTGIPAGQQSVAVGDPVPGKQPVQEAILESLPGSKSAREKGLLLASRGLQ